MKNLKHKQYYIDFFDRLMIESCRRLVDGHNKKTRYRIGKKMTEKDDVLFRAYKLALYFEKGEGYIAKEEGIVESMERDSIRDEILENAVAPEGIYCKDCGGKMNPDLKVLDEKQGEDCALFFYKCSAGCKRKRVFYSDGEESLTKPSFCKKCDKEIKEKHERKGNIITTKYFCTFCGFKEVDKLDISVKKEKSDKNFKRDRAIFCLTKKEGEDYKRGKEKLKDLHNFVEKMREEEKGKDLHVKVAKIKKLNIAGLKKVLEKPIKSVNFSNLEISNPENNRYFIVNITAQDSLADRENYNSRQDFKKAINSALENTNWRLMMDGVSYRLGVLSARLRAFEGEEGLIELVKKYES